jgi:hypothetical protein
VARVDEEPHLGPPLANRAQALAQLVVAERAGDVVLIPVRRTHVGRQEDLFESVGLFLDLDALDALLAPVSGQVHDHQVARARVALQLLERRDDVRACRACAQVLGPAREHDRVLRCEPEDALEGDAQELHVVRGPAQRDLVLVAFSQPLAQERVLVATDQQGTPTGLLDAGRRRRRGCGEERQHGEDQLAAG